MRSVEDKSCYNLGPPQEVVVSGGSSISFEFHKGNGGGGTANRSSHSHHRAGLGKPRPSKWDDAQKWLVGLSRGGEKNSQSQPRNSNADDRRLIAPVPQKEQDYYEVDEEGRVSNGSHPGMGVQYEVETKKMDCDEPVWRVNKHVDVSVSATSGVRSICVRDMGTEMTPIASQEPSRSATPVRATTPVARSPISSGSTTPVRSLQTSHVTGDSRGDANAAARGSLDARTNGEKNDSDHARKLSPLESRAVAWDEAERAKYMARYKREEVKIQAWENHEKRKAEMEMKKIEAKAERLKARAQEKCANKLTAARRIAEEKRVNAEAKLNEKAVQTSERADYIRRTGHLPSSFSCSFKLPSLCW